METCLCAGRMNQCGRAGERRQTRGTAPEWVGRHGLQAGVQGHPRQTDRLIHKRKQSAAAVKEAAEGGSTGPLEVYEASCIACLFFCCAGRAGGEGSTGRAAGREPMWQGAGVAGSRCGCKEVIRVGTPGSCSEGRGCQELLELGRRRSDGKVEAGGLRAPIRNIQKGSEDTGDCWLLTADLLPPDRHLLPPPPPGGL